MIKDAHFAVVFYTAKVKLQPEEVSKIISHGGSIIVQFENFLNLSDATTRKLVRGTKFRGVCFIKDGFY